MCLRPASILLSPTHSCLHPWDPGFICVLLFPIPTSFQVQELIINKDPTLLDNFLDVSDRWERGCGRGGERVDLAQS